MARDAATLLQHLGFVIILEKSVLIPTPKMEFQGLKIDNAFNIATYLRKVQEVHHLCWKMYKAQCVSILELTELIGLLFLAAQTVFPAKIQFRYLKQLQIQTFKQNYFYQQITIPHAKCRQELKWWIKHFEL